GQLVIDDVVSDVANHLTNLFLLLGRLGDQVVVDGVEEVVSIELVGTGIRLPVPLTVGAFRPARGHDFPEMILSGLTLDITLAGIAKVGIGSAYRQDCASGEAFGSGVFPALGYLREEAERLEGFHGALFGNGIAGGSEGEALAGAIHAGPEPVVIAVVLAELGFVAGFGKSHAHDVAVLGAAVGAIDFILVEFGFFRESHGPALDFARTAGGGEPGAAVGGDGDSANIVVREPA